MRRWPPYLPLTPIPRARQCRRLFRPTVAILRPIFSVGLPATLTTAEGMFECNTPARQRTAASRRLGPARLSPQAFSAFNTDAVGKLAVTVAPDSLSIRKADREVAAFRLEHGPTTLVSIGGPADPPNPETENILLAAIEALFARDPDLKSLRLQIDAMPGLRANLIAAGIALDRGKDLEVAPEMFWQLPTPWLAKPAGVVFPQIHVMTEGKRHPLRPQKPKGLVYARFIPWRGWTFGAICFPQHRSPRFFRCGRWMAGSARGSAASTVLAWEQSSARDCGAWNVAQIRRCPACF